jgi:hypothetical protein
MITNKKKNKKAIMSLNVSMNFENDDSDEIMS